MVNQALSAICDVQGEVPNWNILRPLLFMIYIYDFEVSIDCQVEGVKNLPTYQRLGRRPIAATRFEQYEWLEYNLETPVFFRQSGGVNTRKHKNSTTYVSYEAEQQCNDVSSEQGVRDGFQLRQPIHVWSTPCTAKQLGPTEWGDQ